MITDSVSFLAEYLPSGNPLYFADREDRAKLSDVGEGIIDSYYSGKDSADMRKFVTDVVINGNDPLREARADATRRYLNINEASSGQRIVDCLCKGIGI